jgi:hypothetical protein
MLFMFLGTLCFSQEQGAKYLIITHDSYYSSIQPLAWWKHKKGVRTKVVKLSDIGSSPSAIRNYITDAYNTWPITPEFILLVGAPNYIPFSYISGTYTDNYYTNMDGDIYNEILSGRLTVHSTAEAQTVVNKMLQYERTPDVTDTLWFIKGCLIVNEDYDSDDTIYWNDAKYVANYLVSNGYVQVDTFSAAQGDNAGSVIQATDNGRGFVMYRGSATNNWYYPFSVDPNSLANGNKLPVVVSATCYTLGTGSTPATAERWFLTGTPTTLRGASGYFATTTGGYNMAHLRSAVARGFFNAIFGEGKRTFGEACENGRQLVYAMYPYGGGAGEYYGFTTIGDPEMNIWTAVPQPVEVIHASILSVEAESLAVDVTSNDAPFGSALVCVVLDTLVYEYGYTLPNGHIVFYFDTLVEGSMDITVTGRNIIPYEGVITVEGSGTDVVPYENAMSGYVLEIKPNPCTYIARIKFEISDVSEVDGDIAITIYDVTGRSIRSFVSAHHSLQPTVFSWDCTDGSGHRCQPGIYFCQLKAGQKRYTEKLILIE